MNKKYNYTLEILLTILSSIILASYYFFIVHKSEQYSYYMKQDDELNKLVVLNTKLDYFNEKKLQIILFDEINQVINNFHTTINKLIQNEKTHNISKEYLENLITIKKDFQKKEFVLERLKFRQAFENNVLFLILDIDDDSFQKLPQKIQFLLNEMRVKILSNLITQDSENVKILLKNLHMQTSSQDMHVQLFLKNFINRTEGMLEAIDTKLKLQNELLNINPLESILKAEMILHNQMDSKEQLFNLFALLLLIIIIILLLFILDYYKKLKNVALDLLSYKTAIENSYNVVVITDENRNIIYVNSMFEKVTGYTKEEALGNNPRVLKSGKLNSHFYKKMNEKILNGKKWEGRFINKNKSGELFYEDATITPILDKDKKTTGYLAIKRDVTQQVKDAILLEEFNVNLQQKVDEEVKKNIQKEKLLIEQSKMANMGAMISNIAHQWRQPLSCISTLASGIMLKSELGIIDTKNLINEMEMIIHNTNYLSENITVFRNFLKEKKETRLLVLEERITIALQVIGLALKDNNIRLENTIDYSKQTVTKMPVGELDEIIINIINNAKDALLENKTKDPWVKISLKFEENDVFIIIEDNAGGIPPKILPYIFDEYFTTKTEEQGTGLGLYMSYQIIKESLNGDLYCENTHSGAKFFIKLPLSHS